MMVLTFDWFLRFANPIQFLVSVVVYIYGSGIISGEYSSSILQISFCRPLKRWHYIFSKWLALFIVTLVWTGLFLFVREYLNNQSTYSLINDIASAALVSLPSSLLMVFISTWAPPKIDSIIGILFFNPLIISSFLKKMIVDTSIIEFFFRTISGAEICFHFQTTGVRLVDIIAYLFSNSVILFAGCAVMNRKEITYAS